MSLSDKIMYTSEEGLDCDEYILMTDIKEFIKQLKQELWIRPLGSDEIIDKLAGDKLI